MASLPLARPGVSRETTSLPGPTRRNGYETGQGLAIARSVVVDKHGGTINCETEQGKGTTLIVRLPIGGGQQTQGTSEYEDACLSV